MKSNPAVVFTAKDTWLALTPVVIACAVYVVFAVITTLIMDNNPFSYYSPYNMPLHYIVQIILAAFGITYLVFSYLRLARRSSRASDIRKKAGIMLLLLHIVLYGVVVVFVLTKYTNCSNGLFCAIGDPILDRVHDTLYIALLGYPILYWPIVIACTLGGILLLMKPRHGRKTVAS